jgi:hypothetical protein
MAVLLAEPGFDGYKNNLNIFRLAVDMTILTAHNEHIPKNIGLLKRK